MSNPGLFWRTVKHLTVRQMLFQVIKRLRGRPKLRFFKIIPTDYFLTVPNTDQPVSWLAGTFTFLNQPYSPELGPINWNYGNDGSSQYGKLWTYNLNYFDFLNQPDLPADSGLVLIHDFINQSNSLRDGLEPYPTSLRIINWIQFLCRNQIQDAVINSHLSAQTDLLSRRLEYHLAGNHLLENGYALLLSSLYFRHTRWFQTAARLMHTELRTQILFDGGHDERSPMYHQLLFDRLLTVLLALQHDIWHRNHDQKLIGFLAGKAHKMLGWLNAITFSNGDVPMVNDATFGISPTTEQLREKARIVFQLGRRLMALQPDFTTATALSDSGYRMFRQKRYELFADVGMVGPDHQPGHAHADTFSFVLYVDNFPLIVDNSVSTYQIGSRREWERSTAAHNTVTINDANSSEVWAGFRLGRRARVSVLTDTQTILKAQHDGYSRFGVTHERAWFVESSSIRIVDRLIGVRDKSDQSGIARFHFHPTIQVKIMGDVVMAGSLNVSFSSVAKLTVYVTNYEMAEGFNRLCTGQCLNIEFTTRLETTLILAE